MLKVLSLSVLAVVLFAGCNGSNSTKVASGGGTNPNPTPTPTVTYTPNPGPTVCPLAGPCNGPPIRICPENEEGCGPISPTELQSTPSDVKDVDLQKANMQDAELQARVSQVADHFQMSMDSARQVTVLSDRLRTLTANGKSMTAEDRDAITKSALELAGVSMDDIGDAITKSSKGDPGAVDDLFTKAALNLGMPSSKQLRDELLPSLGVDLN